MEKFKISKQGNTFLLKERDVCFYLLRSRGLLSVLADSLISNNNVSAWPNFPTGFVPTIVQKPRIKLN